MSSLEEPLSFDKLPSMSTIDRIQRFSAGACRPREDDMGMGNCWIDGRSCFTSNSCDEDHEEYTRETFPWRRHVRDVSEGKAFNRRAKSLSKNRMKLGHVSKSRNWPDQQYSSKHNDRGMQDMTNKVNKEIVKIQRVTAPVGHAA